MFLEHGVLGRERGIWRMKEVREAPTDFSFWTVRSWPLPLGKKSTGLVLSYLREIRDGLLTSRIV